MGKTALDSMQLNKHVHQSFSIAVDECHLQKKCVYFDVSSQRMFHFFEERQVEPLASWLFAELPIAGSQLSYKSGPISAKVLWLGWQGEEKKKKTSGRMEIILNGRVARPICKRKKMGYQTGSVPRRWSTTRIITTSEMLILAFYRKYRTICLTLTCVCPKEHRHASSTGSTLCSFWIQIKNL